MSRQTKGRPKDRDFSPNEPRKAKEARAAAQTPRVGGKGRINRPPSDGPWARLFVGGGRRIGLRPADLVGAITNEAGVTGASIGAIQIADSYSLVEVPDSAADEIARVLAAAKIEGRRLEVRRYRER